MKVLRAGWSGERGGRFVYDALLVFNPHHDFIHRYIQFIDFILVESVDNNANDKYLLWSTSTQFNNNTLPYQ